MEKIRNDKILIHRLLSEARKVIKFSYSPYSNFRVGAAVLDENGKIYTGCNIENASYGLAICAERVAVFNAVSQGVERIKAIAIYCDKQDFCSPCGACRQVIYEFSKDAIVILGTKGTEYTIKTIAELLPLGFCPKDLRHQNLD
ncbi:MAG: cytidine deaminase [Candidatus Scalinduaceae bacterium]